MVLLDKDPSDTNRLELEKLYVVVDEVWKNASQSFRSDVRNQELFRKSPGC